MSDNAYAGQAPASVEYTARVYLIRSAARRGDKVSYKLTITLGSTSATNELGPDFADGLTGGPDFWEVSTLRPKDIVQLRHAISGDADVFMEIRQRAALRNLGCKNILGQKWCHVETVRKNMGQGWVEGRYLLEYSGKIPPTINQ